MHFADADLYIFAAIVYFKWTEWKKSPKKERSYARKEDIRLSISKK
jgi:hypothetical protein